MDKHTHGEGKPKLAIIKRERPSLSNSASRIRHVLLETPQRLNIDVNALNPSDTIGQAA
jgi:hypothetical protein